MYDPCIGAFDAQNDITVLPFIEQNNNVLVSMKTAKISETCAYHNQQL